MNRGVSDVDSAWIAGCGNAFTLQRWSAVALALRVRPRDHPCRCLARARPRAQGHDAPARRDCRRARSGAGDGGLPATADIREAGRQGGRAVSLYVDALAPSKRPVPYCERLAEPNVGLPVPQLEGVRTARQRCELAERTQGYLLRPPARPIYEGGDVKIGRCHTLPNSGVKQTGDYQIIDNTNGAEDVARTLELSVSDTLDESITLDESVEFSNSTTVEAGADIGGVSASASNTFSTTLGIDKSKTDDHSTTTTRTVTTEWAIPANTKSVAVFSADRTVIDCHVDIGASMNWPGIRLSLGNGFQPLTDRNYWQEGDVWVGNNPFSAYLTDVTDRHGDLYFPGGGGVEDVWRLLKGFDVRGGNNLRFEHWPPSIAAAIETLADASFRFLSFNGTRRSVSNDSASVTFLDVTGVDNDEIDRRYGEAGAPIGGYGQ